MNTVEIIIKKRRGEPLSKEEIESLASGFVRGKIPDYQMSAFLMACFVTPLTESEIFYLTDAMLRSGVTIDLPGTGRPVIDKHSTGGVGDKISLILVPLMAACGVGMAMLSGRGLGHTGGTIDKLESIDGFDTALTPAKFKRILRTTGMAISGQTEKIAPADRDIYALRDATGTVPSIGLITSSILSKKLALQSDGIVFDVKCGNGAFMKTENAARQLAESLLGICKRFERPARAVITAMSQPLGHHIGNYLEIVETILFLRGNQSEDLAEVTFTLGKQILDMAGIESNSKKSVSLMKDRLTSGAALDKFRQLVKACGGSIDLFDNPIAYHSPKASEIVPSPGSGYISSMDTELIGRAAVALGTGRTTKEEKVSRHAGIILYRKIGERVEKSEPLLALFADNRKKLAAGKALLQNAMRFGRSAPRERRTILKVIK
jgi:pyrimidine-nucleoside phosphorylase